MEHIEITERLNDVVDCMELARRAHGALYAKGEGSAPTVQSLFVAEYVARTVATFAGAKRTYQKKPREVPEWFRQELTHPAIVSRHHTASGLLRAITNKQPTNMEAKQCGAWLRAMGIQPRKTNGATVFFVPAG